MGAAARSDNATHAPDRVRCLECGDVYLKPHGRGTAGSNPGCPTCGYIGWVDADVLVTPAMLRNRFAADPLRRRSDRPR